MAEIMDISDFDRVYEIMKNSFPTDEYRTYSEQKALLNDPAYKIYIHRDNNLIVAFIAVWEFHNLLFIEHFAVDSSFRGCGLGSKILEEITGLTSKQICLEVEIPSDELSLRRVEFYKRNGFFLNEFPYVQPAISFGKKPVQLNIMTFGKKATRLKFNDIKFTLYKNVYKILH